VNEEPYDAAADAMRQREAKDPRELTKYLRHCERIVVEHLRAKGWPVDDYVIELHAVRRGA
jgi:hypothetical protein